MKLKLKLFTLLMALVMVISLAACGSESTSGTSDGSNDEGAKKIKLNLSTPDPDTSSITLAGKHFAELVKEKSGGSIEVSVHPNGTLYGGDPSAAVKQLGAGSIDMLALSTSLYANFVPEFNAISVPYLFDSKEKFVSFLNGEHGDKLLSMLDELKIEGLGLWTRPFRQITNSKHPIKKPEDLKGIKIRVPNNPLWVEFFKRTGAVTTPMDFSEVYNALQLGTIGGQENPVGVIKSAKLHEVQKYLTISNHMADGWILGINQAKFGDLTDDQKKVLQEAAKETQSWKLKEDEKNFNSTVDFLKENGMKVNELTSDQQKAFVEVSKEAYPAFKKLVENDEFFQSVIKFAGKSE
ncbi:DctP family TRAP transporter solute-binding subunit [Tuberibacillus sp. Marseille-P3662]|uniref:DctP family TRAP transporter solute-binding subunit n=1 Tax=Tuberibacillus sp. Marseille-P3662 TaxID=1965358 RepID=UPI000A1CDBD9|nr:DctP family TRAP transporter solute-binding subunit [Tuberibacillus sp. Marseille-P3662]